MNGLANVDQAGTIEAGPGGPINPVAAFQPSSVWVFVMRLAPSGAMERRFLKRSKPLAGPHNSCRCLIIQYCRVHLFCSNNLRGLQLKMRRLLQI
jgi:hypothetical protein